MQKTQSKKLKKKGLNFSELHKANFSTDKTFENSMEDIISNYKTVALIDFSNLVHICYNVAIWLANDRKWQGDIEPPRGTTVNMIKGKITNIKKYAGKDSHLIFVMDCGRGNKGEVLKDYKGTREHREYNPIPHIAKWLFKNGYDIKYSRGEEADDCIATLSKKLKGKVKVIIMTGDQDIWQLKSKGVEVVDLKKGMGKASREVLETKYGLKRFKDIVKHKVFFGDSSDNIKPILPYLFRKPIIQQINNKVKLKKILSDICIEKGIKYNKLKKMYKDRKSAIKLRDNLGVYTVKSSKSIKAVTGERYET